MCKVALVTGSTKGIGLSIGLKFLKRGYYVFFNYCNNDANMHMLESKLFQYKGKFSIIKADLSNYKSIDILYNEIDKKFSYIDCIVLNAGITCRNSFKNISISDWNKVMNTNVTVPFFVIQKLSPLMRNNGRIVFIGSILGTIPHGLSIPYSVSKSSLNILCKSLVKIFKDRYITANVINAGFIDTSWHITKSDRHTKRIKNKIALNRFGHADEIASTCMHIIDNEYINGANIVLDGGYDMG